VNPAVVNPAVVNPAAPTPRRAARAALAAAVLLAGCSGTGEAPEPTRLTAPPAPVPAETTTRAFADADAEFVRLMVRHHQQALGLAALVPERTGTPEVVVLAQEITADRAPRLRELQERLGEWDLPAPVPATTGSGPAGDDALLPPDDVDGGLSATQVQAIREAEGAQFDRLWLEGMVAHHEGGIALAEAVLSAGAHRPTLTFAERLVVASRAELSRMEAMLGG
jgi:uncharacterized protein (DUF305 family)